MWEMILAGRYMMIPITLASLVGLAVIIERVYVLRQGRIIVPEIAEAVETLSASKDLSVAYAICERRPGPFANVIKAGLDNADNDWTLIRDVLQETGRQEATRLTRRLGVLETVAAVSPLLGLLGTVLGILIINLDMRPALAAIRRDTPAATTPYVINEAGAFPTLNFKSGQFEGAAKISGEAQAELENARGGRSGP